MKRPDNSASSRDRAIPRYRAIARRLAKAIEDGILRPGERLPSIRDLCEEERVSVSTVNQALGELESLGLVESRPRSGYYVRPRVQLPAPARPPAAAKATAVSISDLVIRFYRATRDPNLVLLSVASPSVSMLPTAALARALSSEARRSPTGVVAEEVPPGLLELRAAISQRAFRWGCLFPADDIVVTAGAIEAVTLGLLSVASRGQTVAVESPAFYGTLHAIEALGLKVLEVPCDPETGMDLDVLERQLDRHRVAAVVSVPNFSNPLGSCMPDRAKERLVRILAVRGVPLIEDDVFGDLVFFGPRPKPVNAWDTDGNVIYCGSFSKSLGPGFRLGFGVPGRFRDQFELHKFALNVAVPAVTQRAMARYLRGGGYDRHLRLLRARLQANMARVSAAIAGGFPAGTRVSRPKGGCFLWVELPPEVDALELYTRALEAGVCVAPGQIFSPSQANRNCIRISCGEPWSERIAGAIRLVGRLAASLCRPAATALR